MAPLPGFLAVLTLRGTDGYEVFAQGRFHRVSEGRNANLDRRIERNVVEHVVWCWFRTAVL